MRSYGRMGNKLFGTDGVRGVANVYPMTADFAMKLAMVAGKLVCTANRRAAIARDTRISGDMLEAAMIAGFTSQGVDVVRLGVLPTPAATLLTPSLGVDMTVMITASHNPYYDNGIKLIAASGDKFGDDVTARLEAAVVDGEFSFDKEKLGRVSEDKTAAERYKEIALGMGGKELPLQGLKVVLDCANGCFSEIMPEVFAKLGADVTALSCMPDGTNINRDCGSQHIDAMTAKVHDCGAMLGIAADGDGDRIIICDEKGNRVDGDQIIAFLGKYYKEHNRLKADTVVATIVSNPALDRFLEGIGVKCVRSAVGERYVIEEMKKCGSNIGGEESGHMVVADYAKTGDTMMAALVIAMGLLQSGKKMSEIFPLFTPMTRKRIDSKFCGKDEMLAAFELAAFQAEIKQGEADIAGKGRILVRKSGTEPKIQVWVWGDDVPLATAVSNRIASVLEKADGFESRKEVL